MNKKYSLNFKMNNGELLSCELTVEEKNQFEFDKLKQQILSNFQNKDGMFQMKTGPGEEAIFSFKDVVYFKLIELKG